EVTFDIDANGILHVTAKDLGTGKEAKITITAATKLSQEEKERMIKEAEQYAELDKKKREEVELRNDAEALIYTSEKTKKDLGDKLTQQQKEQIDKAVSELRDALSGKDIEKIKQKREELRKVLQEVGTIIYQQAASEYAKQQKEGQEKRSDDKTVNTDYKVT
ncbi:MAG: Hsp70 family protein, partial [Nitrososphaeria archaeon]